jgi:hypothetical protein
MFAEPQKEHCWLQKLIGEWTYEHEANMGPDKPPQKLTGTESVRSLGGLWVLLEGQGECPGHGIGRTLMTLGYDPAKKRYIGAWVGSMMTHMWIYNGQLDPTGKVLTLDCEGPSWTPEGKIVEGKTAKYQDIIEFKSDDHRVLRSQSLGDDGKWTQFMEAHYRRRK